MTGDMGRNVRGAGGHLRRLQNGRSNGSEAHVADSLAGAALPAAAAAEARGRGATEEGVSAGCNKEKRVVMGSGAGDLLQGCLRLLGVSACSEGCRRRDVRAGTAARGEACRHTLDNRCKGCNVGHCGAMVKACAKPFL